MLAGTIDTILKTRLSPLDYLPPGDLREKLVHLAIRGIPGNAQGETEALLRELRQRIKEVDLSKTKVIVFGGGTGLSNIIGGDSRADSWQKYPFTGLKEIFPLVRAVVCVTDNGGSTGELLKDLPIMAIGDIRHVLLSSVRKASLQQRYGLTDEECVSITRLLADIFNWRFAPPLDPNCSELQKIREKIGTLPKPLGGELFQLIDTIFSDSRFTSVLTRPHCFGNLLIVSAIYSLIPPQKSNEYLMDHPEELYRAIYRALERLSALLGTTARAVLPCTPTSAQLRVIYTNGVAIPGEHKLADASRGFPVSRVEVEYFGNVHVYDELLRDIEDSDIIIFAPGSLYSSIIPIFKVPGLADAVRRNRSAMKLLISNLWVQAGETDLAIADPGRKFHVSDMIRAYERNIPGGTGGLFNEVICISLNDISASVLQRYAVEGKIPIYLDRETLVAQEYIPIECDVHSRPALTTRGVIQHDPDALATVIRTLYAGRDSFRRKPEPKSEKPSHQTRINHVQNNRPERLPCRRYQQLKTKLAGIDIRQKSGGKETDPDLFRDRLVDMLWNHPLIPLVHLDYFSGIDCIDPGRWRRDQRWDNVFSFYDPQDRCIKIRGDQLGSDKKLEVAFLIALGESLLGDYAEKKQMQEVVVNQNLLGRAYNLYLRENKEFSCYFNPSELCRYLRLARMCPGENTSHFTRLVNKEEGFTPPGLLMGLMYAWYIDNRLATHIEYKMSVMRISRNDLIPEQLKMLERRQEMITFFREVVFMDRKRSEAS